MGARDHHQVRDAGHAKSLPMRLRDGTLIAHHQRRQHAGRGRGLHALEHAVAHPLARLLQRKLPAVAKQLRRRRAWPSAHAAGGVDALLPQPQLEIEATRIGQAVRALQARRQAPALAGAQLGQASARVLPAPRTRRKPRQPQPLRQRHGHAVEAGLQHHKLKLPAQLALARQTGHVALQHQIAPFELRIQRPGLKPQRPTARAGKQQPRPDQQPAQAPQLLPSAPKARLAAPEQRTQQQRRRRQRAIGPGRPQQRLLQLQPRTTDATQHQRQAQRQRGVRCHGFVHPCCPPALGC